MQGAPACPMHVHAGLTRLVFVLLLLGLRSSAKLCPTLHSLYIASCEAL